MSADKQGPEFAIDGHWSNSLERMFVSNKENMPWFQWHLPNHEDIIGIYISDVNGYKKFETKIEVRAGINQVDSDFKGKIGINTLCKQMPIFGGEDKVHSVICDKHILAEFVTIQIIDANTTIQINELEIIRNSEGIILQTKINSVNILLSKLLY